MTQVTDVLFRTRKPRRFVPGKCPIIAYKRPPIDRPLRQLRVTYDVRENYDRELLSRVIFVEEALRVDANNTSTDDGRDCEYSNPGYEITVGTFRRTTIAADDDDRGATVYTPPHRCSDPRTECVDSHLCKSSFLKTNTTGYLLRCASLYFSYFYDIPKVYQVQPIDVDNFERSGRAMNRDVVFGAALDQQARELYICCDERTIENSLTIGESIADCRLTVNDFSLNEMGYSSMCDRRVFSVIAFIMNVERLIYDSLTAVTRERTLAELTFVRDDADSFEVARTNDLTTSGRSTLRISPLDTNVAAITRLRMRDVHMSECFL